MYKDKALVAKMTSSRTCICALQSEILEHISQQLQKLLKILEEGIDIYGRHEALHYPRASALKSTQKELKRSTSCSPAAVGHFTDYRGVPGACCRVHGGRVGRISGKVSKFARRLNMTIRELRAHEGEDEQDDGLTGKTPTP